MGSRLLPPPLLPLRPDDPPRLLLPLLLFLDRRGAEEDGRPDERANATSVAVPSAINKRAILIVKLILVVGSLLLLLH